MRKAVFGVLITIVFLGLGLSVVQYFYIKNKVEIPSTSNAKRQIPQDAQLVRLSDGKSVALSSFKGKVVLLNFWASWCEACMAEMPSMNKLYEELKGEGLEILAVNVDENPTKVVPEVIKKLKLVFPVYVDRDNTLTRYFDVMAIPFSAVLSKDQQVLWAESGERNWAASDIVAELRKAIK